VAAAVLATATSFGVVSTIAACTNDDQPTAAPVTTPLTIAPLAQQPVEEDPIPTMPFPAGFVPADTRGEDLPTVSWPTMTFPPVPVFGGQTTIRGTVIGPDGPVPEAIVRLERFVGDRGGWADVETKSDGTWEAKDVYGGRYRVRAFRVPDLATLEPQTGFVLDDPDIDFVLDIGVEKREAFRLQAALDIGDPRLDVEHGLDVLVDREWVNESGVVIGKPIPGTEIEIAVGDGLDLTGEPIATAGDDGRVRFGVTCTTTGPHDVTLTARKIEMKAEVVDRDIFEDRTEQQRRREIDLRSDDITRTVSLPECTEPEATTTTQRSGPFEVGDFFTTPYGSELPGGAYRPVLKTDCETDYETFVFLDNTWERAHSSGEILLRVPGRNFEPSEGSEPCTFERIR
jgi:hypothetical protein